MRIKLTSLSKTLAACALGLIAVNADAAVLRLDITGFVAKVDVASPNLPTILEDNITKGVQGDAVTGYMLIDTDKAYVTSIAPNIGTITYSNVPGPNPVPFIFAAGFSVAGMDFSTGDFATSVPANNIAIITDDSSASLPAADSYMATSNTYVGIFDWFNLHMKSDAVAGNAGLTDGLSLNQPLTGGLQGVVSYFSYRNSTDDIQLDIRYVPTALSISEVSAVPVPAAVWLFSSGLLGLIGSLRRNKGLKGSHL